jgi:hypothetical protein
VRIEEALVTTQTLTIESLEEWVRAGAHWRVVRHSERGATVELQECTGRLVQRVDSDDPAVIEYLRGVESDLDLI